MAGTGFVMADKKDCHTGGAEHRDQKGSAKADGKHGHKNSKKMMHRMAKSLNLTDVQEGAIKELMQAQYEDMTKHHEVMALMLGQLAKLDSGSEAYIAKAQEVGILQGKYMGQHLIDQGNTEVRIMELLTPEQSEKYQQMHNKMAHY